MAGRGRMNGGETCRDNVRDTPPVRPRKYGPEVRQTPWWSAGRRACRVTRHAASPKVPELLKRLSALRSLTLREGRCPLAASEGKTMMAHPAP